MSDIMEHIPKSNWGRMPGSFALIVGFWHKECWVLLGIFFVAALIAHIVGETRFKQAEKPIAGLALVAYYAAAADVLVRLILWLQKVMA